MDLISELPVALVAVLIFCLRIIDVSLGTVRMIAVVNERTWTSFILGFGEVSIWIIAVSQVISRIDESIFLALAYSGGFAAGNAIGIILEKKVAFGIAVLRMISSNKGLEVAQAFRDRGQIATTFDGEGRDGPVVLIYATCKRRKINRLVEIARSIDPQIFYVIERANAWSVQKGRFSGRRARFLKRK